MVNLAVMGLTTPLMFWGALFVALPIVAHLLNRRVRRRIVFPSLRLLSEVWANQSRFMKLRRWLLLLLRCLAVGLVASAFARPFWTAIKVRSASDKGGVGVVLLVDLSPSMGQRPNGVTMIDALRSGAQRVLDSLAAGTDYANIVTAGAHPRVLFPEMTRNIGVVQEELRRLTPGYGRGDLNGAIALAGAQLAAHEGPRRLVILSDLQETQWSEVLDNRRAPGLLPEDTAVTLLDAELPKAANIALSNPRCVPRYPILGRPTELTADLTNHSDEPAVVHVTFALDDQTLGTQVASVRARETAKVTMRTTIDEPGPRGFTCSRSADALQADNRIHGVVEAFERRPVLVVTDGDASEAGSAPYFVTRALAPRGTRYDRYGVRVCTGRDLPGHDPAQFLAVLLTEVVALPADAADILFNYARGGGSILCFAGTPAMRDVMGALDKAAGEDAAWLPFAVGSVKEPGEGSYETIGSGDWNSRFLRVFDIPEQEAVSRIRFRRVMQTGRLRPGSRALLSFGDSSPAVAWRACGPGQVAVAGFSPSLADSDIGKYGAFVALLQSLLRGMRPTGDSANALTAGQGYHTRFLFREGTPFGDVSVKSADGRSVMFEMKRAQNAVLVYASPILQPGYYEVRRNERVERAFACNVDRREGDLRPVDGQALVRHLGRGSASAGVRHIADDGVFRAPDRRELWPWVLAGVLAALAAESLVLITAKL